MIYVSRATPNTLTIPLFVTYGGQPGAYSAAQQNIAITQAELMVENYLSTYLVSTTVTGSFPWPMQTYDWRMRVGCNYLISIGSVVPQIEDNNTSVYLTGTGYAFIRDFNTGVIDLRVNTLACNAVGAAYMVQLVYTAGLNMPNDPNLLLVLTLLTQWYLTAMFDGDNFGGGQGDPAVISWSSLDYSQSGQKLLDTFFGSSPMANMITRLLKPYKQKPAMALGR